MLHSDEMQCDVILSSAEEKETSQPTISNELVMGQCESLYATMHLQLLYSNRSGMVQALKSVLQAG